jgi:hypothetical protein
MSEHMEGTGRPDPIKVSAEDMALIRAACEGPPPPLSPALLRAAERYRSRVRSIPD